MFAPRTLFIQAAAASAAVGVRAITTKTTTIKG
jgi:hypothetical protein